MIPYSKDGTIDLKELHKVVETLLKKGRRVLQYPEGTDIDPRDVSDRKARHLGVIYASQGQPLKHRAGTYEQIVQLAHEGTEINPKEITALPTKGTPQRYYSTASGEVQPAPATGYKLRVYGFYLMAEADEILRLRYGGATGEIFAGLPMKGVAAMNLVNVDEAGGEAENIYLEKTGTGNALAVVWTETVAV